MTTTRTEYAVKRDCLSRIVTLSDGRARRATRSLEETAELVAYCDGFKLLSYSNGELEESDFEVFGAQCGKFTKTICGICHDRFIIVEQKEIFWTGASLKVLGRTCFRFRRGNGGQAAFAKLAAGEIRHIKKSAFVMGVGTRA